MEDGLRLQPHTRAWLRQSALEAHIAGYCADLASRGYAASTQRVYLGCVAHFAHWMRREKLDLNRLDEGAVARYLAEHLPRCDCPEPVRRLVHENRAALVHLLASLRHHGAVGSLANLTDAMEVRDRAVRPIYAAGPGVRRQYAGATRRDRSASPVARVRLRAACAGPAQPCRCAPVHRGSHGQVECRLDARDRRSAARLSAVPGEPRRSGTGAARRYPQHRALATGNIARGADRSRDRAAAAILRSAVPIIQTRLRDGALSGRSRPAIERGCGLAPRRHRLAGRHGASRQAQIAAHRPAAAALRDRPGDQQLPRLGTAEDH